MQTDYHRLSSELIFLFLENGMMSTSGLNEAFIDSRFVLEKQLQSDSDHELNWSLDQPLCSI
jgi:hypothetical protein